MNAEPRLAPPTAACPADTATMGRRGRARRAAALVLLGLFSFAVEASGPGTLSAGAAGSGAPAGASFDGCCSWGGDDRPK